MHLSPSLIPGGHDEAGACGVRGSGQRHPFVSPAAARSVGASSLMAASCVGVVPEAAMGT